MDNIFVQFLPPWVETGLQPAFYDKESGTVLQQTARMYARVNMLIRMFNKLSKQTKEEIERFERVTNEEIERFEQATNDEIERFERSVNDDMTQYKHDIDATVADYIERFTTLYNYVHDYFDNLDVQEEIDHKLDELLDQGVLQEIIVSYVQTNVVWTFDSVADMKLATNLINGSYARTLGFRTINDGGGALYKIVDSGTANEMDVIAIGDLYATLTNNISHNVKEFGAYGDGTHDDTTYVQEALDFVSTYKQELIISDGTYMIDASTGVLPKSNSTITFLSGKLKAIPNNLEHSQVVKFDKVENIVINDCVIVGERDEHLGSTGEWGHCIYFIGSCSNITFNNADLSNAWGDGIEMFAQNEGGVWKYPKNIYFNGTTYIHHCGRQGVSIIAGEYIYFDVLDVNGVDRTPPCAAIDIETEGITWYIGNIHIGFLKSEGTSKAFSLRNKGGITGNISVDKIEHVNPIVDMNNPSALQYISPVTIFFDYYTTDSAKYSINIGDVFTDYGTFLVQNAYIGATPTVHISNIFSKQVQAISSSDVNRFRSVFYIYYDKQCTLSSKLGGIYVDNIVVENMIERDDNNLSARYYSVYYNFDDNASKTFEDCVINCTLVKHDANINFTGAPMPTSNVVFNNVDIKMNIPPQNIRSASNSDTTKIVGGLTDIYFTPTDATGTNRRLILRPTDALIGGKVYAKGNTTLKINLAYNSTHFTGVYENGNAITIDGSNNYVLTTQTESALYNITTDDKNIYVEVV